MTSELLALAGPDSNSPACRVLEYAEAYYDSLDAFDRLVALERACEVVPYSAPAADLEALFESVSVWRELDDRRDTAELHSLWEKAASAVLADLYRVLHGGAPACVVCAENVVNVEQMAICAPGKRQCPTHLASTCQPCARIGVRYTISVEHGGQVVNGEGHCRECFERGLRRLARAVGEVAR